METRKPGKTGGDPLGKKKKPKRGGYSAIYWDTLDEDERELINGTPSDEETLLVNQIKLFEVRERRILKAVNQYESGGVAEETVNIAQHLEKELTSIQRAKAQTIKALSDIRKARRQEEERGARTNKPGLLAEFIRVIEEEEDNE